MSGTTGVTGARGRGPRRPSILDAVGWAVLFATAFVVAAPAIAECPPRFSITLVEGPDCGIGGTDPQAVGMNGLGQFAGDDGCFPYVRPIGWFGEGPATVLDEPPGYYSAWAYDINDDGWIVGRGESAEFGANGFVWHDGTIDVIEPPGYVAVAAFAVNSLGHVVGESSQHAFMWVDGVFTDLQQYVVDDPSSRAWDINDHDDIVGERVNSMGTRAIRFDIDAGASVDLPHLDEWGDTTAFAINENGVVVGQTATDAGQRACIWSASRTVELGIVPGYDGSTAVDINSSGWIVGQSWMNIPSTSIACLWTDPEHLYRLGDLVFPYDPNLRIKRANAINNAGQITGDAANIQTGHHTAFVLTPLAPVVGDLDCDLTVGFQDLLLVLSWWGPCATDCNADADGSGVVDSLDLLLVLGNWSRG